MDLDLPKVPLHLMRQNTESPAMLPDADEGTSQKCQQT